MMCIGRPYYFIVNILYEMYQALNNFINLMRNFIEIMHSIVSTGIFRSTTGSSMDLPLPIMILLEGLYFDLGLNGKPKTKMES